MSDESRSEDTVVDAFMEDSPRASHLQDLCDALLSRIKALREEIDRTAESPERSRLEDMVQKARQQLAVLRQELAISQFVEESVRVTLRHESPVDEEDDEFWP